MRPLVRGERAMLPVEFIGAPREFDEYYRHDGEEFVYVVLGLIEVDIEGELHPVAAGDSIYYSGGFRHRWRSLLMRKSGWWSFSRTELAGTKHRADAGVT